MIIGVVGLGLMGASVAKELCYIGHQVYGADNDCAVVNKALKDGVIVKQLDKTNARDLDVLLIAVYSHVTCLILQEYAPCLKDNCIVMDMAGNKRNIVDKMTKLSLQYPKVQFVGGHPMAGREVSGYDASKQGLFLGARMLIIPINLSQDATKVLYKLFEDMGVGKVVVTTAKEHDENIAYTSQLAHVLSNAYIKSPKSASYYHFSAGSFRDLTRVAGLNVPMWTELMMENSDNLIAEIDVLISNLNAVKNALASGDKQSLAGELKKGDTIKKNLDLKPLEL